MKTEIQRTLGNTNVVQNNNILQPTHLYSRIARLSLRESKCSKWRLVIYK
jgi:hypothetical protein